MQLKAVRHFHTPMRSFRVSNLSAAPVTRLSNIKRCALTIAAGPRYSSSDQNEGQEVVQAAHIIHLVVSSKLEEDERGDNHANYGAPIAKEGD